METIFPSKACSLFSVILLISYQTFNPMNRSDCVRYLYHQEQCSFSTWHLTTPTPTPFRQAGYYGVLLHAAMPPCAVTGYGAPFSPLWTRNPAPSLSLFVATGDGNKVDRSMSPERQNPALVSRTARNFGECEEAPFTKSIEI